MSETAIVCLTIFGLGLVGMMLLFGYLTHEFEDKPSNIDDGVTFIEKLPALIAKIDVDTTRFHEYIWGFRAKYGLDTNSFIYTITGSNAMKIDEIVENFKEYKLEAVYKSEIWFRGILTEEEYEGWPEVPRLVIGLTHYVPNEPYTLVLTGDPDEVSRWEKYFLETFQAPTIKKVQIITGVNGKGELKYHDTVIQEKEKKALGFDAFYPFIEGGLDKLAKDFEEASEAILLLIGPYGTGKSTLIRTLILKMTYENFGICNNQKALLSPEITDWIGKYEDSAMVALEDADSFIKSREDGNDQMSSLLNLADGIIKSDRKIVISTNLANVNSVDQALTRSGRAFKTIEFRPLTIDEANAARAAVGLPSLDGIAPQKLTLSDALNFERVNNVTTTPKRVVGFTTTM